MRMDGMTLFLIALTAAGLMSVVMLLAIGSTGAFDRETPTPTAEAFR